METQADGDAWQGRSHNGMFGEALVLSGTLIRISDRQTRSALEVLDPALFTDVVWREGRNGFQTVSVARNRLAVLPSLPDPENRGIR